MSVAISKVFKFVRNFSLAVLGFLLLIIAISTAQAAGALAVGSCGAYGYGFDYSNVKDASAAAMSKCVGGQCKVVGIVRNGCAAMAVDAKNPCGSFGWAINSHLGKAENASMRRCSEFGGHDCVVRAWACDEKG
jgi:Domain of unknown function (DUF4189)